MTGGDLQELQQICNLEIPLLPTKNLLLMENLEFKDKKQKKSDSVNSGHQERAKYKMQNLIKIIRGRLTAMYQQHNHGP